MPWCQTINRVRRWQLRSASGLKRLEIRKRRKRAKVEGGQKSSYETTIEPQKKIPAKLRWGAYLPSLQANSGS